MLPYAEGGHFNFRRDYKYCGNSTLRCVFPQKDNADLISYGYRAFLTYFPFASFPTNQESLGT